MTVFIAFFIIIATGTMLHPAGVVVDSAEDAARALEPLAGNFASHLFAIGLLNASFLAAFVLPLATAYGLSEAFGWESGINKTFREAPQFLGFYTAFIVIGAGVILLPNAPLIKIMFLSQTINGILLPIVLVIMLKLVNNQHDHGRVREFQTDEHHHLDHGLHPDPAYGDARDHELHQVVSLVPLTIALKEGARYEEFGRVHPVRRHRSGCSLLRFIFRQKTASNPC